MPVTPEEFQALVQREMARYNPGGDTEGARRDQAVRSANIAAGRGNSTALKRGGKAAKDAPAPKDAAAAAAPGEAPAAVPVPTPRPSPLESLFLARPEVISGGQPPVESQFLARPEYPSVGQPDPLQSLFLARPEYPSVGQLQPPDPLQSLFLARPEFPSDGQPPQYHRTRFPPDLRSLFQ